MKSLSLTQPWASAVALGMKTVETRSWATNYRGPIAIHAAKGYPRRAREFASGLRDWGIPVPADLPLGAVVATARLVSVERTEVVMTELDELERLFGDYSPGRWAWFLADVVPLRAPVPAVGHLGLWEWDR